MTCISSSLLFVCILWLWTNLYIMFCFLGTVSPLHSLTTSWTYLVTFYPIYILTGFWFFFYNEWGHCIFYHFTYRKNELKKKVLPFSNASSLSSHLFCLPLTLLLLCTLSVWSSCICTGTIHFILWGLFSGWTISNSTCLHCTSYREKVLRLLLERTF